LPLTRHLCHAFAILTLASRFAVAHTNEPQEVPFAPAPPAAEETAENLPSSWLNQLLNLAFSRFFAADLDFQRPELSSIEPLAPPPPVCAVHPVPEISDADATAFEANVGSAAIVNLDGLTPTTARALSRLERIVAQAGGMMYVTSAYRPSAYQEHLQAVWDKWTFELRDNTSPECQALRSDVHAEFMRHQLLATQRPVPFSDHTRGIGFDASIRLPGWGKSKRRRVSIDILARRAGVHRPDIFRDPVHFRSFGG